MGPKKGKGKGKKKPDPGWAKTIQYGNWSRPYESMPNATVSAAFAAIRVEFLAAAQELDMIWSQTLAGDFLEELFSVPRPNLVCNTLEWLSLSRSKSLTKALVEARSLQELAIDNCLKLSSLMVWSSQLTSLIGLDDSKLLQVLFLDCPILKNFKRPELYVPEKPKVFHPLLLDLRRWEDKQAPILEHEFGLLAKDLVVDDDSLKEDIVYPNNPRFPRTHLQGF